MGENSPLEHEDGCVTQSAAVIWRPRAHASCLVAVEQELDKKHLKHFPDPYCKKPVAPTFAKSTNAGRWGRSGQALSRVTPRFHPSYPLLSLNCHMQPVLKAPVMHQMRVQIQQVTINVSCFGSSLLGLSKLRWVQDSAIIEAVCIDQIMGRAAIIFTPPHPPS